ncbi:MAG: radical SAM protein [Anaerolineae bacterium]|nr:radical SAM protein [Anaerolineae bacterium]
MTQILGATESVCPECLARIPAEHVQRDGGVYLRKTCPEHGAFEAVIWRGGEAPGYAGWTRPKTPAYPQRPFTPVERGCPFDCGLCPEHRQQTCTALLEVTQRCNLRCPVCFAASGDAGSGAPPDPPLAVIEGWYRRLLEAGGPYNIQLSGGEPTLRDDLPEIIQMGRALGFGFIQVNTNGLRFAQEPGYLGALVDAGLSSVFLQFDGVEDAIYRRLRGRGLLAQKIAAIEQCAAHHTGVILVPTLTPGVNLHNVGAIIAFALDRLPTVRGVHFQPVSYFGRYPTPPRDDGRVTIPEVIRAIEAQTGGKIRRECFGPPGCENARCSFHGNFVLMPDGELISWTQPQPRACACEPEAESAAAGAAKARDFVAQNWIAPGEITVAPGGPSLGGWDVFLQRAKTHAFCISGMAFQDAWTLDLARLRDCCIHTVSPDGRIIPFCAYNLTDRQGRALYRGRDRDAAYAPGTLDRA